MIESNTIDPFTASAAVRAANEAKVEEMQSRMRGLASAVKNLKELDEWNMSSRESSVPLSLIHI